MLHYYRKFIEKSRSFRRIDLFLLTAALAAVVLVTVNKACGTVVDIPKRVTVTVSAQGEHLFGKDTVGALMKEFEEQNADLQLLVTTQDTADIVFFDDGEYGRLLDNAALAPLDSYGDPDGGPHDLYDENRAERPAAQWALPLVSFMDLFYYNIDILKAANCDRPPKTRAEFLAAARAVAENSVEVFPFALGLNPADPQALRRELYPWIWTNGGEIYTADSAEPALSKAAVDTIAFFGQLGREGLLAPGTFVNTGRTRLEEFAAGKIAMMTASAREIAFLRKNALGVHFGVTAIPAAVQGKSRLGLSAVYAGISGNCTAPDQAWRFLDFIAEKSYVLAAALGAVPGSFPNALLGDYIEQDPLYSKAWDIFEAADIVDYNGSHLVEEVVNRSIREKLAATLP